MRRCLAWLFVTALTPFGQTADLVEVAPLTDRIVMVHLDEGEVVYHQRGQKRNQDSVRIRPLDVRLATRTDTFRLSSPTDANYRSGRAPLDIGRKTKGTEFAWFVDSWENNMAVNRRPDHAKEHWLYLVMPKPLQRGARYTLRMGTLAKPVTFTFDERRTRSEAVRVNNLGYVPWSPAKFAYVHHWMGDRGGLELQTYAGKRFWLVDLSTGKDVFEGRLRLRAKKDVPDTAHPADSPPLGNYQAADVYECDFSAFNKPGRYAIAVEGIGRSFPFRIADNVYQEPFFHVARALYHNRSGIELKRPYTDWVRPAPHHPRLTPGFAGKLQYTTVRMQDWGSEGGDPKALQAGFRGALEAWGWYQDAGDWDGYVSHLRVAQELLIAHQLAPQLFKDRELNIPESGNGVADILDEAAWLPRFCHRLRQELLRKGWGTGGVGLRVAGDAFGGDTGPNDVGRGSWEDVDRFWAVSGEDALSTFRYAGTAAALASALGTQKDPEGVDWAREAREAFAWALKNQRPDEAANEEHRDHRMYAAAALYRLTGEEIYQAQFAQDAAFIQPTTQLWGTSLYGPAVFALHGKGNPELLDRVRKAVLATAESSRETAARRPLRFGGNFFFPLVVGQATTPLALELAVGYGLSRDPKYLAAMATTADYFLGTNGLGMTWITGVGPRSPQNIFHMDAWYNTRGGQMHPGLIPYGPWRKERDLGQGPWDVAWPHKTVHPGIDRWPGAERWFENRCSPLHAEFTIHQNSGPAAAFYGLLKGRW